MATNQASSTQDATTNLDEFRHAAARHRHLRAARDPRGDRSTVRDLARRLIEIRREDPTKIDAEMLAAVNRVGEQLRDYFLELVRERRAHPTECRCGDRWVEVRLL